MPHSDADSFLFLVPGLLHQFGNLQLTIQGGALTLAAASLEQTRQVILTANDRGSTSLAIMRVLFGEPVQGSDAAENLLQPLLELLRVPVRERQQQLDRQPSFAAPQRVEARCFVIVVVEAVRRLLDALPDGVRGTLTVGLSGDGPGAVVPVRFVRAAGSLPFPLPTAAVQRGLLDVIDRRGLTAGCRLAEAGVDLVFPIAGPTIYTEPSPSAHRSLTHPT